MAQYADLDAAKLDLGGDFSDDEGDRLADLATALSAQFEARTGRSWGVAAPSARTVAAPPAGWTVALLPVPARSVSAVAVGGQAVDPAWWRAWPLGASPAHGVELLRGGAWAGDLAVTAEWADEAGGGATPPADVVEALTYLTVAFWLRRKESPEGLVGPDGMTAARRFDPWKDSRVAPVVARYRIAPVVV